MFEPEILEEKEIVKLPEMIFLWNPTEYDIEMRFDGRVYSIPSKKFLKVRDRVANCLLQDYSHQGIVQISDPHDDQERASKEAYGLFHLYQFLMNQLHSWVDWMSDQRRNGRGIIGEPIRVKELKVLIADLEDRLSLPRQLGFEVYEEIEEDRQRLVELKKGRKISFIGNDVFVPQPVAPQINSEEDNPKKKSNKKAEEKAPELDKKYFKNSEGVGVNTSAA